MRQLRYIWKMSLQKVRSSKMAVFLLIMFVEYFTYTRPLIRFSKDVNYPVSWCVFPFLMTNHVFLILFWFGIIYINSDVPFMQYSNMYQVIRTGRKRWIIGQIFGIIFRSIFAVAAVAIPGILFLLPHTEFTNEWGKALRTLAAQEVSQDYDFKFKFYYEIFAEYTPIQMMGLTILILALISAFIGILMLVVALYSSRAAAVIFSTAFCLMIYPVLNADVASRSRIARYVPAVWGAVARSATPSLGYYWLPDVKYMLIFLLIGIFAGAFLCVQRAKYVDFHWVNEDA